MRAVVGALRIDHEHARPRRQCVTQHGRLIPERVDQRLDAFERHAVGEAVQLDPLAGVLLDRCDRAPAHLIGRQQLATRVRLHAFHAVERPLTGHGERAHRLDLVAEELDADRVITCWREDVDQTAPDRDLAASFDQLGSVVVERDKIADQHLRVVALSLLHDHRLDLFGARHHVLHRRQHRCDHDARLAAARAIQCFEAARDRLRPRREALVRQRLPWWEHRNGAGEGAELRPEPLGIAQRRNDDEPGIAGARQCREHEGARGIDDGQRAVFEQRRRGLIQCGRGFDQRFERGIGHDE